METFGIHPASILYDQFSVPHTPHSQNIWLKKGILAGNRDDPIGRHLVTDMDLPCNHLSPAGDIHFTITIPSDR